MLLPPEADCKKDHKHRSSGDEVKPQCFVIDAYCHKGIEYDCCYGGNRAKYHGGREVGHDGDNQYIW